MKIIKIFNNNSIAALSDELGDIILTGSGIGFQKKIGDLVDESRIEKTYIFKEKVDSITVVSNTELLFQLKDGSKITKQWQFKRRQPAWSEERKKRQAEKMKEAWRKKHEQNKDN